MDDGKEPITMTRPQRWPGDSRSKAANWRTHQWATEDGRCWECESRMFGISAEWPCGDPVPREVVPVDQQLQAVIENRLMAAASEEAVRRDE